MSDIRIETITIGGVNAFLLTGNDGSVLIDTGYYKNREKLYERVQNENLKMIILTHGHIDHIGGAKYLQEKMNVPIAMHEKDKELRLNNCLKEVFAKRLPGKVMKTISVQNFKSSHYDDFKVDVLLDGKSQFTFGDMDLRIVELPGHTAGSIGVMVNKSLIAGDAVMNMFAPTEALIFENFKEVVESLKKICQLNVEDIYTGHGAMIAHEKLCKKFTKQFSRE